MIDRMERARAGRIGGILGALAATGLVTQTAVAQSVALPPIYSTDEMLLSWPVSAENAKYSALRSETIREVTEKLADIAKAGRDREQLQLWGRIIGTQTHDDATQWAADKLRQVGVDKVETIRLNVPPQVWPSRWSARVRAGDTVLELPTAIALGHGASHSGDGFTNRSFPIEYVGLGTEADFRGRDVKGKAVMIYSQPNPSMYQSTAGYKFGATERARKAGAALIVMAVGLPGNVAGQAQANAGDVPVFNIGAEDFAKMRELLETSPVAPTLEASLVFKSESKPRTNLVYGMLPGTTDENVILSAHIDGYYEGAYDNGAGVGALIAIAEYFAARPQKERRRNIYFVINPGHHEPSRPGTQYIARNWQSILAKTALMSNLEHPPYLQGVAFPDGWRYGTGPGAVQSLYNGGSNTLRKITIDSVRSFGVATSTTERPMLAADAVPEKRGSGITVYRGMNGGDLMDIAHYAPFFQIVSADWPYHSTADTTQIIHWPGVTAYARAHARIVDQVNGKTISELSGRGHPIARP